MRRGNPAHVMMTKTEGSGRSRGWGVGMWGLEVGVSKVWLG